MNRINEKSDTINFIGSWKTYNDKLFDNIIDFFEKNIQLHSQGAIDSGINLKEKKTTDLTIDPVDLTNENFSIFNGYFKELFNCYDDYKKQWPFISGNIKNLDIPSFNVQRYLPGEHFSKMHAERSSTSTSHRLFAWMTYLNDLDENAGGCTNFQHFGIKVKSTVKKNLFDPDVQIV